MRAAIPFYAALLLANLSTSAGAATELSAAEEQAICATWTELDAAWAARDVERITGLFAEDAIFAFPLNERRLEGRPAIRAHFAAQFPRQSAELRHVTEVLHIQPLDAGLAVVDADVRVLRVSSAGDARPEPVRAFAVVAVMAKGSRNWALRGVRAYPVPAADRAAPLPGPRSMAGMLLCGEGDYNPFAPCRCVPEGSDSVEFSGPSPEPD